MSDFFRTTTAPNPLHVRALAQAEAPQDAPRAKSAAAPTASDKLILTDAALRERTFKLLVEVRNCKNPDRLKEMDSEAQGLLLAPGLKDETRGLLHLLRVGTTGHLALEKDNRGANGKISWNELHQAVALAPGRIEVAQVYGREIVGIQGIGFAKRYIVTHFLGADLGKEAAAADKLLAGFPNDPASVLTRQQLAEIHKNPDLKRAADAAAAALQKSNPTGMERARAALAGDKNTAKAAEAIGE
jgi:hypothetical protein